MIYIINLLWVPFPSGARKESHLPPSTNEGAEDKQYLCSAIFLGTNHLLLEASSRQLAKVTKIAKDFTFALTWEFTCEFTWGFTCGFTWGFACELEVLIECELIPNVIPWKMTILRP